MCDGSFRPSYYPVGGVAYAQRPAVPDPQVVADRRPPKGANMLRSGPFRGFKRTALARLLQRILSTMRRLPPSLLRLSLMVAGLAAQSVQAQDVIGTQRRQATRAELELAAAASEDAARSAPDEKTRQKLLSTATGLRGRLTSGDFAVGDRIVLGVLQDTVLSDTFTVRNDQKLQLPNLPDISLRGVLDSELAAYLGKEIGRYIKEPTVRATGLVRLAMVGAVVRPGFLDVATDQVVSAVLMSAGGPTQNGRYESTIVRRAGQTLLDKKQFAEAIRTARTVGDIAMRDGDEIFVPVSSTSQSGRTGWLALALPLLFIARRVFN